MTGKNRLWRDFYDPVSQNDGQRKHLVQPLLLLYLIKWIHLYFILYIIDSMHKYLCRLCGPGKVWAVRLAQICRLIWRAHLLPWPCEEPAGGERGRPCGWAIRSQQRMHFRSVNGGLWTHSPRHSTVATCVKFFASGFRRSWLNSRPASTLDSTWMSYIMEKQKHAVRELILWQQIH